MSNRTQPQNVSRVFAYLNGGNQPILDALKNTVRLNAEDFDTLDEYTTIAPYTFTPKHAGYYMVVGHVTWFFLVANLQFETFIDLDGAVSARTYISKNTALTRLTQEVSKLYYLTPNNTINLSVQIIGSFAAQLVTGYDYTYMLIHRLS